MSEERANGDNLDCLVGCLIPRHLVDAFDDFVTGAVCALDSMGPRSDWSDWEHEIVEWMESDKWRPNPQISRDGGKEPT